jgi:hypothetical protein
MTNGMKSFEAYWIGHDAHMINAFRNVPSLQDVFHYTFRDLPLEHSSWWRMVSVESLPCKASTFAHWIITGPVLAQSHVCGAASAKLHSSFVGLSAYLTI